MKKEMCLNDEHYVVMSNDLIKGKSNLTLNELKLLRLTIMQVMKHDTDFQTYQISIKELAKMLNITTPSIYREVDEMTTHLLQSIIYVGDGNLRHKYKKFQWTSECAYDEGIVTIKLHSNLKPYLLALKKHYTQYMLQDILILKSVYSIRLYELIREEMHTEVYADKVAEVELSVDEIRKATSTEKKYEKFAMLKNRVIDSAINEINEKLCYHMTYDYIKQSRKVVGIKVKIESKNNIRKGDLKTYDTKKIIKHNNQRELLHLCR